VVSSFLDVLVSSLFMSKGCSIEYLVFLYMMICWARLVVLFLMFLGSICFRMFRY